MTELKVRVGNLWLDSVAGVGDLRWSTAWRLDDYCGELTASVSWAASPTFDSASIRADQTFEVLAHGFRLWGGVLDEPVYDGNAWSLNARGVGSRLERWQAVNDIGAPGSPNIVPWTVPNDIVDYAESLGAPFSRYGVDLGGTPITDPSGVPSTPTAEPWTTDIKTVLVLAAQQQGKRLVVDSSGAITFEADPTTSDFMVRPREAYLGTVDTEYFSLLRGYYVSSVDGTTGLPDGWASVYAEDTEAAAQFGHREAGLQLYECGLLTSTEAQAFTDGRFDLIGARTGWANSMKLDSLNLYRAGAAASPLYVKAGTLMTIPGVIDSRSQPETRASLRLVGGQVEVNADERTAIWSPVGMVTRGLVSAMSSLPKPPTVVTVAP